MKNLEIIKKKDLIDKVALRWEKAYLHDGAWLYDEENEKGEIYHNLKNMKNPTEKQIKKIIGNDSWTSLSCDICEKKQEKIVRIAQSSTICIKCLEKAIKLLRSKK